MVKAHVIISGRVQGVFFRAYTQRLARSLNIVGWVKNIPYNKVEAVFEGKKKDVTKMIQFCYKGPPSALVENVEIKWGKYTGEFSNFEIKYF